MAVKESCTISIIDRYQYFKDKLYRVDARILAPKDIDARIFK